MSENGLVDLSSSLSAPLRRTDSVNSVSSMASNESAYSSSSVTNGDPLARARLGSVSNARQDQGVLASYLEQTGSHRRASFAEGTVPLATRHAYSSDALSSLSGEPSSVRSSLEPVNRNLRAALFAVDSSSVTGEAGSSSPFGSFLPPTDDLTPIPRSTLSRSSGTFPIGDLESDRSPSRQAGPSLPEQFESIVRDAPESDSSRTFRRVLIWRHDTDVSAEETAAQQDEDQPPREPTPSAQSSAVVSEAANLVKVDLRNQANLDEVPDLDRFALQQVAVSTRSDIFVGIGRSTSVPLQQRRITALSYNQDQATQRPGPVHCFQTRQSTSLIGVTRAGLLRSFESLRGISVSEITCGREHWIFLCSEDPEFSAMSASNGDEMSKPLRRAGGQFANRVFVCGSNEFGQLGLGPRLKKAAQPRRLDIVAATKDAVPVVIACGSNHSVIVCSDSSVLTFGKGSRGRLGHAQLQPTGNSAKVSNLFKPRVVDYLRIKDASVLCVRAGAAHTLVLLEKRTEDMPPQTMLFSFGRNSHGQCGSGDRADRWIPYLVGSLLRHQLVDAGAGRSHSAVVTKNGEVFVFGDNSLGQCGPVTPFDGGINKAATTTQIDRAVLTPTAMPCDFFVRSLVTGGDLTYFKCSSEPPAPARSAWELAALISKKRAAGYDVNPAELWALVDSLSDTPGSATSPEEIKWYVTGKISRTGCLRSLAEIDIPNPSNLVIACDKYRTTFIATMNEAQLGQPGTQFGRSNQLSAAFLQAERVVCEEFLLSPSDLLMSAHECSLVFNEYCFPGVLFVCSQGIRFHGHYFGCTNKISVNFDGIVSVEKTTDGTMSSSLARGSGVVFYLADGAVKFCAFTSLVERDRAFTEAQRLWWPFRVMFKDTRPKQSREGEMPQSSLREFAKQAVVGGRADIRARFQSTSAASTPKPPVKSPARSTKRLSGGIAAILKPKPVEEWDETKFGQQSFECLYSYEQLLQFDFANTSTPLPQDSESSAPPARKKSSLAFWMKTRVGASFLSSSADAANMLPTQDVYGFAIVKELQLPYFKWARQYARSYDSRFQRWVDIMELQTEKRAAGKIDLFSFASEAGAASSTLAEIVPRKVDGLLKDFNTGANSKIAGSGFDPRFPKNDSLYKLVRKGIPSEFRGAMWFKLSGAEDRMKRSGHYYSYLFRKQMQQQSFYEPSGRSGDEEVDPKHERIKEVSREIELDIRRTFSDDVLSSNADWSNALRRVLIAYAMRNPSLGYCQSMNVIAGVCLMFMPEEHAFWTLTVVVEELLNGYFSKSMVGLIVDFELFEERLALMWPDLGQTLKGIGFNLPVVMSRWFLCLFFGVLPTETALHVWDMFFLNGQRWLFGVAGACFRGAMLSSKRRALATESQSNQDTGSAALARGTVSLLHCGDEFAVAMIVAEHVRKAYVDPNVLIRETEEVLSGGFFNDKEYPDQRAKLWRAKLDQIQVDEQRRAERRVANREKHEAIKRQVEEEAALELLQEQNGVDDDDNSIVVGGVDDDSSVPFGVRARRSNSIE